MSSSKLTGGIKNFFFHRKLNKTAHNDDRSLRLMPFSEAKYIGIIAGPNLLGAETSELEAVFEIFNKHQKNYFLIAVCGKKSFPNHLKAIPHIVITKKDITMGGVPSEKILEKIKLHHFDFLIDLNQNINKTAFFLDAVASATLRIGKAAEDREPFFDLLIEWKESISPKQFIENIIHYLSMLNNKK